MFYSVASLVTHSAKPFDNMDCAHFTDKDTDDQSMKEKCTCMYTVHTEREADGGAQPRLALSLGLMFLWQAPILVSELFLRRN